MTEDKFKEISEARKEYLEAKRELENHKVYKNPFPDKESQKGRVKDTEITVSIHDGREYQKRSFKVSAEMARHLYNQEYNRLMAVVHHLKHKYEKL